MIRFAPLLATCALGLSALAPLHASAQVSINLNIGTEPPPVRYEPMPAPRPGYVWAPGYWDWKHHKHVWVAGHWERERVGYIYAPSEWRHEGGEWRLYRGGWREDEHYRGRHRHHDRDDDDDHGWHCPPGQAKKGRC
jgi:hypothetical protein